MDGNKSYQLKVSVLTPLHVGSDSEKFWQNHVDYYYKESSKTLFVINTKKVFAALTPRELSDWTAKMTTGKIAEFNQQFFKSNNPEDFSDFDYKIESSPKDFIRTFTRNGMGKPYIPGSSIKGAIRSALFDHIYHNKNIANKIGNQFRPNDIEKLAFGDITNNLMHFLQVFDVQVSQKSMMLLHTKTFNLIEGRGGDWEGGWKHGDRSDNKFKKDGFVFTYECLKPVNLKTSLTLTVDSDLIKYKGDKNMNPEFVDLFQGEDPIRKLFKIINQHTENYIDKEIGFFNNFPNDDGDSEYFSDLLTELKSRINSEPEACFLRLGQGSGFHSITGDWRFENHIDTISEPDEKNQRRDRNTRENEGTRYKSRKVTFTSDEDGLYFNLLGFIKLTII